MSDPRVWIHGVDASKGWATPNMIVTKSGYTVNASSIPWEGIAFYLGWASVGTLYVAGSKLAANIGSDGVIATWPDLGYVPISRVLGRFSYSNNKITTIFFDNVVTYSDKIKIGSTSSLVEIYYFVYTKRAA